MVTDKLFDVLIIGGSYAGLSAAMALGRSLRNVLVIDSGKPCNAVTPHSHNFLTQDGNTPAAIAGIAREQVAQYATVQFLNGLAVKGSKTDQGFEIMTAAGEAFTGRKLIFATGIKDQLLPIEGFAACWGISVIHCPYCHGYEYRSLLTGILANGDAAMHYAQLVSNLTRELTIFTNGTASFTPEQQDRLQRHKIQVIETRIEELVHQKGYIQEIVLEDKSRVALQALYARVPFVQHSAIPVELGCELTEHGHIQVDAFQKTNLQGVYACGDNAGFMRAVANAVATGNLAGVMTNNDLADDSFNAALS